MWAAISGKATGCSTPATSMAMRTHRLQRQHGRQGCEGPYPEKGVRAGVMDDLHNIPGMEKSVIVQMNKRNPQVFDPYLVNIETGDQSLVRQQGELRGLGNRPHGHHPHGHQNGRHGPGDSTRATEKEPFKEIMRTGFKDSFSPLFFTFDNKNLYASSNLNGRDKTAIVEWDIAKKEIKEIFENADYDVDGLDFSRKRNVLTW
jgi:hypothetical protein